MGVTEGGIHWLDGLIFIGLCLALMVIWKIINAIMDYREVQKMLDQKDFYNWEEEEW